MFHALVYYPKFDSRLGENIEAFRRKYDPFVVSKKPHMPFIFPVPCSEVEEKKVNRAR
jgi:hypothetical protein